MAEPRVEEPDEPDETREFPGLTAPAGRPRRPHRRSDRRSSPGGAGTRTCARTVGWRVVRGAPRRRRALGSLRHRDARRHDARVRARRRLRDPARSRRLHDRRRAVRPDRVDRAAGVRRLPAHRHVQPRARDAALHRPRRLDGHREPARRPGVARSALDALRDDARASSSGTTGARSTRPATGCSPRSTGRPARCGARRRSARGGARRVCRSGPACTSARSSSSAPTCAASRCTKPRGS